MQPRFHIITAVTRPDNLNRIAAELMGLAARHDLIWHLAFDPHRRAVGGQKVKNNILDQIACEPRNWLLILDDDTLLHPELLDVAGAEIQMDAQLQAIVVSQQRRDGSVLRPCPHKLAVGRIDAGQVILRRTFVAGRRIPDDYSGDGMFLTDLLTRAPGVMFLDRVLSFHNALG